MPHLSRGEIRAPSSLRDQGEVGKYGTGTNSYQQDISEDIHEEEPLQRGPLCTNTKTITKKTHKNWLYIMEAYYIATLNPSETSATEKQQQSAS